MNMSQMEIGIKIIRRMNKMDKQQLKTYPYPMMLCNACEWSHTLNGHNFRYAMKQYREHECVGDKNE